MYVTILVRKPKRVDLDLQGPCLMPRDPSTWQQPLWGSPVRILRGHSLHENKALKVGKRRLYEGEYFYEPDGTKGTSWEDYRVVLRALWRSGMSEDQARDLLERDPQITDRSVGACARHAWQVFAHGDDSFSHLWQDTIVSEPDPFYLSQTGGRMNKDNGPYDGRTITNIPVPPFECRADKLEEVREFLKANPELTQIELVKRQTVFLSKGGRGGAVFKTYVEELERQGLAAHELRRSGGRGRPAKVWRAVWTEGERELHDLQVQAERERHAETMHELGKLIQLDDYRRSA